MNESSSPSLLLLALIGTAIISCPDKQAHKDEMVKVINGQ